MKTVRIDFVSDVACPWCAVGLYGLEIALASLKDTVTAEIYFQPFQLNPSMPAKGQDITEHITQKYGISAAQADANYQNIRQRGADVGFVFREQGRGRTWNTFDAHRLIYWAGTVNLDAQNAVKKALLAAYFTQGQNPSDAAALFGAAQAAGLDEVRAKAVIKSDEFTSEVKAEMQFWQAQGINSVPAVIIDRKHLISGGQPPAYFEQVLRKLAQS